MSLRFEWDPEKATANWTKHSVTFEEAATVFLDPLAITYPDPDHSDEEEREITIGRSPTTSILFVAHTERSEKTRIISARRATSTEREQYEKGY